MQRDGSVSHPGQTQTTAENLARVILAGLPGDSSRHPPHPPFPESPEARQRWLQQRIVFCLGRPWPWIPGLAQHLQHGQERWLQPPHPAALAALIGTYGPFRAAFAEGEAANRPASRVWLPFPPEMAAAPSALAHLRLPALATPGELAHWLCLTPGELAWFADQGDWLGEERRAASRLIHYRYQWLPKRQGGWRLLEIPKLRLKEIQTRILREILDRVPAHPAAHGCRRGRSILTAAQPHCQRQVVYALDLADFFPRIGRPQVQAIFQTLGYPPAVARCLAALTTHATPPGCIARYPREMGVEPQAYLTARRRAGELTRAHLPQGAPSSPALANLCAHGLDRRLYALARQAQATYTRYVDDLYFSGDEAFQEALRWFRPLVREIVVDAGFVLNPRKERVLGQGVRQQVAGVVVNQHPAVSRAEFDQLKAILTNCRRHGVASQNRAGHPDFLAHLAGRIAHVQHLQPDRGARLWALWHGLHPSAGNAPGSPPPAIRRPPAGR